MVNAYSIESTYVLVFVSNKTFNVAITVIHRTTHTRNRTMTLHPHYYLYAIPGSIVLNIQSTETK